jgi:hypothetical protein
VGSQGSTGQASPDVRKARSVDRAFLLVATPTGFEPALPPCPT